MITATHGEVTCKILEPITGNMGYTPPTHGFFERIRELCTAEGIVMIVDEVKTCFRVAYGSAQERYGEYGTLFTFGRIIGGRLPVGAFGGKQEIMNHIPPQGSIYQAGTLSGNPLAMSAGPPCNFAAALSSDTESFAKYFCNMLDAEINLAPSQFETGFMSIAHCLDDLDRTIEAARKSIRAL